MIYIIHHSSKSKWKSKIVTHPNYCICLNLYFSFRHEIEITSTNISIGLVIVITKLKKYYHFNNFIMLYYCCDYFILKLKLFKKFFYLQVINFVSNSTLLISLHYIPS